MNNIIVVKRTECLVCGEAVVGTENIFVSHVNECQKQLTDEDYRVIFRRFLKDKPPVTGA